MNYVIATLGDYRIALTADEVCPATELPPLMPVCNTKPFVLGLAWVGDCNYVVLDVHGLLLPDTESPAPARLLPVADPAARVALAVGDPVDTINAEPRDCDNAPFTHPLTAQLVNATIDTPAGAAYVVHLPRLLALSPVARDNG